MQKQLITFLFLLITSISYSQGFPVKFPNYIGEELSYFQKSHDWKIVTQASGDLNYDRVKDLVIVIESKDSIYEKRETSSNKLTKGKARILLVFLQKEGKQIVHTQNNKLIARSYEGGMSFYIEPKLSIEKNKLVIFHEYVRFFKTYTFQYKNEQFMIVHAENSGRNGASGDFEYNEYDFENKKLTVTEGNIGVDEEKITVSKFEVKPKSLSEFNEMYEWEVMKDHFL